MNGVWSFERWQHVDAWFVHKSNSHCCTSTILWSTTCRRAAYIAVFQSVLPAHDACVAMWAAGSGQRINVYQMWSWDRRQGDFLGIGISTRTHPRHGQSSQLRLVSVLSVSSTQFYGDSAFVRYRVDETVGVHVLWYCFSGSSHCDNVSRGPFSMCCHHELVVSVCYVIIKCFIYTSKQWHKTYSRLRPRYLH